MSKGTTLYTLAVIWNLTRKAAATSGLPFFRALGPQARVISGSRGLTQ